MRWSRNTNFIFLPVEEKLGKALISQDSQISFISFFPFFGQSFLNMKIIL